MRPKRLYHSGLFDRIYRDFMGAMDIWRDRLILISMKKFFLGRSRH